MKIIVVADCGDETCASVPGTFCRFFGTKSMGQRGHCLLYGEPLYIGANGWTRRCQRCLEEFPAPDPQKEVEFAWKAKQLGIETFPDVSRQWPEGFGPGEVEP